MSKKIKGKNIRACHVFVTCLLRVCLSRVCHVSVTCLSRVCRVFVVDRKFVNFVTFSAFLLHLKGKTFYCRQNKTKREVEIAAAVETAVDVNKVRRRRKKQEKTKTDFNVQDEVDGSQGSSKTRKDAKFNRGYDTDVRKDTEASGETSKARENLGYEVEQETGETSKELDTMEKSKTEKRRRKKLKGIYKRSCNVFFNLLKIFVRYN